MPSVPFGSLSIIFIFSVMMMSVDQFLAIGVHRGGIIRRICPLTFEKSDPPSDYENIHTFMLSEKFLEKI